MIQDFKTYIGEGTLWGNTIIRSDTDRVRKEDEITEEYVRSFLLSTLVTSCKKVIIRKENGKPIVDIIGDFVFKHDITEIPFQFGTINGCFYMNYCSDLTSLKGCPKKVTGDFRCDSCVNLTSLEGCPKEVGKDFYCYNCENLTSLEGCPEEIGGSFCCNKCTKLTSLEGCPKEVGLSFFCSYCNKLTSLEGAPEKIGVSFDCHLCKNLTSLKGCPKEVACVFYCNDCGKKFTEKEVRKYCDVKGTIHL